MDIEARRGNRKGLTGLRLKPAGPLSAFPLVTCGWQVRVGEVAR
jgi:hypothetical protein